MITLPDAIARLRRCFKELELLIAGEIAGAPFNTKDVQELTECRNTIEHALERLAWRWKSIVDQKYKGV